MLWRIVASWSSGASGPRAVNAATQILSLTFKMKELWIFEILGTIYLTIQHNIPEDLYLPSSWQLFCETLVVDRTNKVSFKIGKIFCLLIFMIHDNIYSWVQNLVLKRYIYAVPFQSQWVCKQKKALICRLEQ